MRALRARLPGSVSGWLLGLAAVPAWVVILGMIVYVLKPTLTDAALVGQHDWDQMESHRELVVKTLRDFHQFPFWQPYACGGHPNWGGFESGTTIVSPWLPVYLLTSLPHAMRIEIWGSALWSALGAWLLAGRFTRSAALRALAVVAFAVNGRWALQITQGHTWHLAYAWTPWTLYFYDRAVGTDPTLGVPKLRDFVLTGVCIAMMVYTGGIYPLPETVFAVAVYGLVLAASTRDARPIVAGLACGALGLGFAAPKLVPVLEVMSQHPRWVESTETLDLSALVDVLTSRDQDIFSAHAGTSQWGWHEWGMYVGWAVVVVVALGAMAARGRRATALLATGLVLFALGLGSFFKYAPWPLLHQLPVFKSQHVPSRWMYPAILVLAVVAGAAAEPWLRRAPRLRPLFELVGLCALAWVARDVGEVARQPITHMFATKMPAVADSTGPFHTEEHTPAAVAYQSDWVAPSLGAILANVGTIDCGTFPAYHNYFRDRNGNVPGLGAHGAGGRDYRGEAYVAEGVGTAELTAFTPNEMTVTVRGAQPGMHVVLNQNWDAGWRANGARTLDWADQVAATLDAGDETVVFRYRPATLWLGMGLFLVTVAGLVAGAVGARRIRRARSRAASRPAPGVPPSTVPSP